MVLILVFGVRAATSLILSAQRIKPIVERLYRSGQQHSIHAGNCRPASTKGRHDRCAEYVVEIWHIDVVMAIAKTKTIAEKRHLNDTIITIKLPAILR